jgi:hypothetical protein
MFIYSQNFRTDGMSFQTLVLCTLYKRDFSCQEDIQDDDSVLSRFFLFLALSLREILKGCIHIDNIRIFSIIKFHEMLILFSRP